MDDAYVGRRDVIPWFAPMMGDERERFPVGPGRRTLQVPGGVAECPGFDADPGGWFEWVDAALVGDGQIEAACRAATWVDGRGCGWRVVVAPEGPEVRPTLGSPFLVPHDLPLVSAMLITPRLVHVELTWRHAREVTRVAPDEVSCLDLGLAMLTATELPHEALGRVGPDTWQRAHDRWRAMLETRQTPIS